MSERKGLVTMKGNPVTLVGNEVKVGQQAPDFSAVANDLSAVTLNNFKRSALFPPSRRSIHPFAILKPSALIRRPQNFPTPMSSQSAWICPLRKNGGAPPPMPQT